MITNETQAMQNHSVGLNKLLKIRLVNSIFAAVLLLTGFVYEIFFPEQEQLAAIIMAVGAISVALPVFWQGLAGVFSRQPKFMTEQLVSLAVLASMLQGDFFTAALIPIIMVAGHLLEEKSIIGVEQAIASLKKMHNSKAKKIINGTEEQIEANDLLLDDIIACYPGEIIAADGIILEGESTVNQASITGESLPKEVYAGIKVYAGTINNSGKITIKVTKMQTENLLSEILALLAEAEKSKAPVIKIIERYLGLYFPFIIMLAAITLFLTENVTRAIAILVISCPCALVLASPTAMIAALVRAARHGIMIKNTAFLETLSDVDSIVFDKTGTLTYGKLELEQIYLMENVNESYFFQIAGMCASGSMHPVSMAIVAHMRENKLPLTIPKIQTEIHGQGVEVLYDKTKAYLGKLTWILEQNNYTAVEFEKNNEISVWVADNENILGRIIFSDKPRTEMKAIIAELKANWVKKIVLLTGDNQEIADKIGAFLEVDEIKAECLPQDKFEYVKSQKALNKKIMFVGDGINDALALKASDVGVAIARVDSNIAVQSSDITLNADNLTNILKMFQLSNETRNIIAQNILIGTGFSFFLVGLASFGLISPIVGALAHNLGPILVLINSARLSKALS